MAYLYLKLRNLLESLINNEGEFQHKTESQIVCRKIVTTVIPWVTIGCSDKWSSTSLLRCSEVCYNECPFVNSR